MSPWQDVCRIDGEVGVLQKPLDVPPVVEVAVPDADTGLDDRDEARQVGYEELESRQDQGVEAVDAAVGAVADQLHVNLIKSPNVLLIAIVLLVSLRTHAHAVKALYWF